MKRSTASILAIAGLIVVLGVIIIAAVGGYLYYAHQVKNSEAQQNGAEFGRGTDANGCVAESVRQFTAYKDDTFLIRIEQFHIARFTAGCLRTSAPTPKFCANVPRKKDGYLTRLGWTIQKCRDAGLPDGGPCNEIFKEVVDFCSVKASEKDD